MQDITREPRGHVVIGQDSRTRTTILSLVDTAAICGSPVKVHFVGCGVERSRDFFKLPYELFGLTKLSKGDVYAHQHQKSSYLL